MDTVFFLIFGYILGSIPFGKSIASFHGVDIQKRGSGNIGFANVRRVLGWRAGLSTLALDITKGAVPTLLAYRAGGPELAFWVGVCAIFGHIYPIWLRFRGGKGIATGLGVVSVLQPAMAVLGLVGYLVSLLLFRKSFIGSLLGAGIVSLLGVLWDPAHWWHYVLLACIAVYALRQNIRGTVPDYDV
jgi:glycerol-3-phosphate acyltransferase PlsY